MAGIPLSKIRGTLSERVRAHETAVRLGAKSNRCAFCGGSRMRPSYVIDSVGLRRIVRTIGSGLGARYECAACGAYYIGDNTVIAEALREQGEEVVGEWLAGPMSDLCMTALEGATETPAFEQHVNDVVDVVDNLFSDDDDMSTQHVADDWYWK